jgi:hypothetical protein
MLPRTWSLRAMMAVSWSRPSFDTLRTLLSFHRCTLQNLTSLRYNLAVSMLAHPPASITRASATQSSIPLSAPAGPVKNQAGYCMRST